MAKMIGVSPTYLSKVERDEFPPPAEDKVKAIAQVIACDVDELLARAGKVASDLSDIIKQQPRGVRGTAADHQGAFRRRRVEARPPGAARAGQVATASSQISKMQNEDEAIWAYWSHISQRQDRSGR